MAFCSKCGTTVMDGPGFCPQCGATLGQAAPPQYGGPIPQYSASPTTSGLQENVAGMLCYLLGWLTGIIFLLIDKRPGVRFHAAQSIVIFGFLFIIRIVLIFGFMAGGFFGFWAFHAMISMLVSLVTLAAWVILMIMAYQGKNVQVPVAAGIARSIAGSV